MIPRNRDILKEANKESTFWSDEGVFNDSYLNYLKVFCLQFLRALKCEFDFVKTDSLLKVVYCGTSDVAYIYLNDQRTSLLLMESIEQWLINSDPYFKGATLDTIGEHYVVELNYNDQTIIEKNKQKNLKTLCV